MGSATWGIRHVCVAWVSSSSSSALSAAAFLAYLKPPVQNRRGVRHPRDRAALKFAT